MHNTNMRKLTVRCGCHGVSKSFTWLRYCVIIMLSGALGTVRSLDFCDHIIHAFQGIYSCVVWNQVCGFDMSCIKKQAMLETWLMPIILSPMLAFSNVQIYELLILISLFYRGWTKVIYGGTVNRPL